MTSVVEQDNAPRMVIYRALVRHVGKPDEGRRRAIDLGCGACGLSDDLTAEGWDVDLIDVDPSRVPERLLPHFRKQSALTVDLTPYSLVLFAGLCYHLSPQAQMALTKKFVGKLVLMDTYVLLNDTGKELAPGYWGYERSIPTKSSMAHPSVPSLRTVCTLLFPQHWVFTAPCHWPGRCWFVCIPLDRTAEGLLYHDTLSFTSSPAEQELMRCLPRQKWQTEPSKPAESKCPSS
jgi:hypothetical protein